MLVLTRHAAESIILPEAGIEIAILQLSGNRVRLGIKAPAGISIERKAFDYDDMSATKVEQEAAR